MLLKLVIVGVKRYHWSPTLDDSVPRGGAGTLRDGRRVLVGKPLGYSATSASQLLQLTAPLSRMEGGGGGGSPPPWENYHRTLVLGGGIAGLSAASHLSKNGLSDYRLLEARGRLGGRVATTTLGGTRVELGAHWIHGILGNPLHELATSHNLLVNTKPTSKPHNVVATTEEGRRLPFPVLQEIYEAYFWFFKRCEEYFLCKATTVFIAFSSYPSMLIFGTADT